MSPKIRVLDDHTINKIAAGEVIENPASVIKELVENGIDAGSSEISVDIRGGGRQSIRVTDNGCGMSADDALLSLERHATSKIQAVEDILALTTMGFRGEAVPSIAAISKFSILTRPKASPTTEGTLILVEGGKILQCCPAASSTGTTIEVKSLFFNVPARKKFQKSPAYDANEILKMMTLLALGYPHIKFKLTSDGETLLTAPETAGTTFLEKLKERIASVLGENFMQDCLPLEIREGDYHIQGWMGAPYQHKQNRTGQYLFINHRGIQSPPISYAIKDGYGTTIPTQRHPIYVLHLTMPGDLVDVNVHPQKKEVRLRQEQILKASITNAVRVALQKEGGYSLNLTFSEQTYQSPIETKSFSQAVPIYPRPSFSHMTLQEPLAPFISPPKPMVQDPLFTLPEKKKSAPRVMGGIPGYLILEHAPDSAPGSKTGLCLVDQRAAHARIIFEHLSRQNHHAKITVQQLLIPLTIELPPAQALCLQRHLPLLESYGVLLKEFGHHVFILDGLPNVLESMDPELFVREIASTLSGLDGEHTLEEQIERRLSQSAVRSSINKDKRLSLEEGQALINQLFECTTPWYCPQGKPTMTTISPEQINKYFD